MRRPIPRSTSRFLFILFTLWIPVAANAYIGPGIGLSTIGSVLAFIGVVVLFLVGFLWYPIKRVFGRRTEDCKQGAKSSDQLDGDSDESSGFL